MNDGDETYVPALRYRWLTRFYDPVVALTTREQIFRKKLLGLITCAAGDRVLDLACGTGTLTRMIKNENPATTVHGLDGDPDILALARRKSQHENLNIRFDEGNETIDLEQRPCRERHGLPSPGKAVVPTWIQYSRTE